MPLSRYKVGPVRSEKSNDTSDPWQFGLTLKRIIFERHSVFRLKYDLAGWHFRGHHTYFLTGLGCSDRVELRNGDAASFDKTG